MKKTKFITLFFLIFLQFNVFGKVKNAVTFGNHAERIPTIENNIYRIFMDMNGHFYPENIISDQELKTGGQSQLSLWAKNYPRKFELIAQSYKLNNTTYTERNYDILQDSIRSSITNRINQFEFQNQTWLIHGFRKKITKDETDGLKVESPSSDFGNLECRNRISTYTSNNDIENLFIEVYWDGKYMTRGGLIRMIKIGFLFKNHAIPNALNCGYALRKIFKETECQKVKIITHSTGTYVVSNLLFNIEPTSNNLQTPKQSDIRIAYTASASPGIKHFKNYYNRSTDIDYQKKDNYSILNFINKSDFVLLKKKGFIKLPKLLGNTTLGCDFKGESKKLKEYFTKNYPNSKYTEAYNKYNADHWFKSYIKSKGFDYVLNFLYN